MSALLALSGSAVAAELPLPRPFEGHGFTEPFIDIAAGLTGVSNATMAWGDYDDDGDLDLFVAGQTVAFTKIARLYNNNAGTFVPVAFPASAGVSSGASAWGDYDGDGDLDLVVAGSDGSFARITRIYQNAGGSFFDVGAGLPGISDGDVAWCDYDNDGDLDLFVTGSTGGSRLSALYRNEAGVFFDNFMAFEPLEFSAAAWGDYDGDGDFDLAIAGAGAGFGNLFTNLYENSAGSFALVPAGLPGISNGSLAWGDYDNDGDPDLLLSGGTTSAPITRIYRNTSGSFSNIGAGLQGADLCTSAWGDFENDGDLDLAVGGNTASIGFTAIYRNSSGSFFDISANLPNEWPVTLAWGDYDNDKDLDLAYSAFGITRVYRNESFSVNDVPSAPTGLSATSGDGQVTFSWNAATDAQDSNGLSYNLRVGTTPGGSEIMTAMADAGSGYRRVVQRGNVGQRLQWSLSTARMGTGPLYWSVQAIDHSFIGSPFAPEQAPVVGVDGPATESLPTLRLSGPNPFRSEVRLTYSLPRESLVDLAVFDVMGRRVARLDGGVRAAGTHAVTWAGRGPGGSPSVSGLYFVRLRAAEAVALLRVMKLE